MNPDINTPVMNNNTQVYKPKSKILMGLIVVLVLVLGFLVYFKYENNSPVIVKKEAETSFVLERFTTADEMLAYMEKGDDINNTFGYGNFGASPRMEAMSLDMVSESLPMAAGMGKAVQNRISTTNVQVEGIDEPDIVKTDGNSLFVSLNAAYRGPMPLMERELMMEDDVSVDAENMMVVDSKIGMPYYNPEQKVRIFDALPVESLDEISSIPAYGDLLIYEDVLMVFENNRLMAFDVVKPSRPEKLWDIDFGDQNNVHTARLKGDKLYVLTSTYVDRSNPCPIEYSSSLEGELILPCTSIYHPQTPTNADVTYGMFVINPKLGEVENKMAYLGSSQAVTYMSADNFYLTYVVYGDYAKFLAEFFTSDGRDLVPESVRLRMEKLSSYELSSNAKMVEVQQILQDYQRTLSADDRRKMENEMANKMKSYSREKMRELETTAIVKIDLNNLEIAAVGETPGHPLNQFSLDEYEDNLRLATTVGEGSFGGGESANDVYVLDKNLKMVGSVMDMGIDERIYSARFMGNRGYLVTFRETDPFYVLDLSNPKDPRVTGELKIPGFSSYLHPLKENLILGVGREDNKVKLSMFDVSDPNNPSEQDKYLVDAYWTDVSETHHAFLQDEKHDVFFLPAGADGYIFAYENDQLTLEKVVSGVQAKRAVYINDNMYVVGEEKIVVLDENDWETVKTVRLN